MKDIEKYDLVNKCETAEELESAVLMLTDEFGDIQGRVSKFDGKRMATRISEVVKGNVYPNVLTRVFGIRQQALYIKHYTSRHVGK